jgi:CelD/BcsL family acetyltransferase involved in cellulose biosynthesis
LIHASNSKETWSLRAHVTAVEQGLRIEWLSTAAELQSVEMAWRALETAVAHRTHVSTFDFLFTWYKHYAGEYGGTPLIGLAWHGSDLAAVAPLTVRRGSLGRIPVTRIDFAPNDSIAGEFLVHDDRLDALSALLDSLVRTVRFDVICFNGFEPESPTLHALQTLAQRSRLSPYLEEHAYAMVDLSQGYDRYSTNLTGNTRRKVNQKTRRIEAMGAAIDGVLVTSSDDIEQRIRRMIAINEASYKLQGRPLANHHREFLAEVTRRFAARDMLSLPILSIGGRDAACILGVVERGCFYDVTLAYDESFASLGPGVVLMQRTLQTLADAQVHTVISHGAHDYKRHWATAFVPQQRMFLFSPRPLAAAARLVRFHLQPLAQRLSLRIDESTN